MKFLLISRKKFYSLLLIFTLISSASVAVLPLLIKNASSEVPWWDNAWLFRKQIIINGANIVGHFEDFPLLLDIIDADLTKAKFDGTDIVFIYDNCIKLDHEIEYFDDNSGRLIAWVKLPAISSGENALLYMYYGNPGAVDQQNPAGVWNNGYVMVQHLEESFNVRFDSTVNFNNGNVMGKLNKVAGKIGVADEFDEVNDYVAVADSVSLNPISALSIELWMCLSSTGNFINLVSKGSYNQFYLRLGPSQGLVYWFVKFSDGSVAYVLGNANWQWNTWHHLAATVDCNTGVMAVYVDGISRLNSSFALGKSLIASTNSLRISDVTRFVKGVVDEVRVSNVVRSADWVLSCYNNQRDPSAFYSIGPEELREHKILVYEDPQDEATGIYTKPTLSAKIIDTQNNLLTIIFQEKIAGSWVNIATYNNVPSGTYCANSTCMSNLGTPYQWAICVSNGTMWTNKTFSLTTTTTILSSKWMAQTGYPGVSGVLAADIDNDSKDEIIYAGKGGIAALKGVDGQIIWAINDTRIGDHAQPQMADLNKDGILEILVPLESPAGLLALHANNGSTYWRIETGLGKETYSSPVVFDIDGNGYPTIFIASTDTSNGLQGTGRITAVNASGSILYQNFAWRPCSGGLSIADTDYDGEFEIYMGERNMYLNSAEYSDNNYGKGVVSFWARNLTIRWYRPEIFCSSQIPMIADVNNDGILDVIVGDLEGGVAVLNATDGSTIRMTRGIPKTAPTHYQPCVYDIDGDGNLEMLMADPHDTTSDDLVIWDLVNWKVDVRIYIGKNFYGPQVADVTGDGQMEIIACNYKSILIIDNNYRVIDGIVGISGEAGSTQTIGELSLLSGTLNYAVVQDIDGDGYNELVVSTSSGTIYAFDTPARRPDPRPRTEVQFYSEFRLGAAEYVHPQGGPAPIICSPTPSNGAKEISASLSQLQFTIIDYQKDLMNITVTTNPDVGSITLENKDNGRYTININNLRYETTYTWTITATDGVHITTATYMFTTQDFHLWWNNTWPYRKPITINHNQIVDNQTNIPVLLDITDPDLVSKAKSDGSDIAFSDVYGNKLNHELELYNSTTGRLITWIQAPILSSTEDTILYMYYGNSAAQNEQNATAVWGTNYVMVQHLQETGEIRYDSTINSNHGTAYGDIAKTVDGKFDGADVFDGVDDYLRINNSPSLNPSSAITIELWMKLSPTGDYINLINKGTYNQLYLRAGASEGSIYWYVKFADGTSAYVSGNTGWKWNTWHYLVATVDTQSGIIKVYLDGIEKLSSTFPTGKTLTSTTNPLLISDINQRQLKGTIDEVRISNTTCSLAWIKTNFNQKDPTQFYTIGIEECIPPFPVVYAPMPANDAINISPSITELTFNLTDCQNDSLDYIVSTDPDIGSAAGTIVGNGKVTVPLLGLQYATTYKCTINVKDGTYWTNVTLVFTTCLTEPPTHSDPLLIRNESGLICYNQTTVDYDNDKVTNIYNWYKNGTSITNLLLPFDTNTITTVKDYSGYGNNGIIKRNVIWTANGIIGGAYSFNRGFIEIVGTSTLDGDGAWSELTIEHWIYLTETQTNTRTIAKIPSYEIGITGNRLFASIWTNTGNISVSGLNKIESSIALNLNTWYHVVLTYKKGVALTLYINGTPVAVKTPIDLPTLNYNIQKSGSNSLYIGWFDYFKGKIDEVRIYPKCLSQSQIQQRYNETKAGSTESSTIVATELAIGDIWECKITPNDSYQDGITKSSNSIVIG